MINLHLPCKRLQLGYQLLQLDLGSLHQPRPPWISRRFTWRTKYSHLLHQSSLLHTWELKIQKNQFLIQNSNFTTGSSSTLRAPQKRWEDFKATPLTEYHLATICGILCINPPYYLASGTQKLVAFPEIFHTPSQMIQLNFLILRCSKRCTQRRRSFLCCTCIVQADHYNRDDVDSTMHQEYWKFPSSSLQIRFEVKAPNPETDRLPPDHMTHWVFDMVADTSTPSSLLLSQSSHYSHMGNPKPSLNINYSSHTMNQKT